MTQEVRTYYADSVHAKRTSGGLMQIPVDGIEVPAEGLCAYVDDITLAGQLSAVNAHNQRLYVVEYTPFDFMYTTGNTVKAYEDMSDTSAPTATLTIQEVPSGLAEGSPFQQYQYMVDLPKTQQNPNCGSVFLKKDETTAVLGGVLFHAVVDPASPRTLSPSKTRSP